MHFQTPMRYPGGKGKLAPFARKLFELNRLCDGQYVEAYAGGAGIAIDLLLAEYVRGLHLNDASYEVYCFWHSVLHSAEFLTRRIRDVRVTPTTWKRQRAILHDCQNHSREEIGFAFLFLNRTNRSGIISGGMIGGNEQNGRWLIDARFYREELSRRIISIAEYAHRISIYCMDAESFIRSIVKKLTGKCCVYYDPPYYVAGRRLYLNTYTPSDHERISKVIQKETNHPWFLTYDDHPRIRSFYRDRKQKIFDLRYSATRVTVAQELMVFSDGLKVPGCPTT